MKLYTSGKEELKAYLSTHESKISFTSDLWTSPNNKAFISATAHYIDDNWNLQQTIIDFGLMGGRHEGTNIADGFFKILKDYEITSKCLAITLDNAANNGTFVRELEKRLKNEHIQWNSEHLRFRCLNHILNLAVQAALEEIRDYVSKIRELNSAIRTSPQRFELLESSCNACQIQYRKPILDCPTRWNSTYDMIVNGLSLKPSLDCFG